MKIMVKIVLFIICAGGEGRIYANEEIKNFVKSVKAQPPKPIPLLPEFKKFESFQYTAQNLRSPFERFITATATKPAAVASGFGPNLTRAKEALEAYPLDSMHMVGTIAKNGEIFSLIKDSQGVVHRVAPNQYMGQNLGKILKISEFTMEIQEWIEIQGQYEERRIMMHLSP